MTVTLTHRGREFEATEDTPVTISNLAKFLHWGKARIYADIERGYQLQYGTETTARHYLAWLEQNPRPRPAKGQEAASKRADVLSQLH